MDSVYWTFRPDKAEALKRGVEQAFVDAVYPGDDHIIVSGNPACCAECGETQTFFRGKHWRDIVERGQALQPLGWGGLARQWLQVIH